LAALEAGSLFQEGYNFRALAIYWIWIISGEPIEKKKKKARMPTPLLRWNINTPPVHICAMGAISLLLAHKSGQVRGVPHLAEPGDKICVVQGSRVLNALRVQADGRFALAREC
jgi:hypothetical protein